MKKSIVRDKVMEEIKLLPEHKLSEVYDFIHYFRIGLQKSKGNVDQIMNFAGCWKDMPEKLFNEFLEDIGKRRKQAFTRRRSGEASIG
ncbi:MAG TPA: hypothetical protein VI387_09240 [Candidatus Brocadiales bacterium]|nr:hypothetical protein [Candidatus Brocadiales bacterium]